MGKETLPRPAAVPASVWDGMNDEARAFVIVLVRRNEQLERRIEELERRLGLNSGNSSQPPSTDRAGDKPAQAPRTPEVAIVSLATLFAVRASRSRQVVHELLGETFAGIVGSDRYSASSHLSDERHQFCWAHLLRDFQALIDRGGASARIGSRLKSAGQELIHDWNRLREGQIVPGTFGQHYGRLREEIMDTLYAGSRCRHPQTAELCRTLSNHCFSLFLFAEVEGVAPTTGAAEQSLRRAVIFRKLSFGTESGSGSDVLAATFSVVETCRRLGRDAQAYLRAAVDAHFQNRTPPPLIIPNP